MGIDWFTFAAQIVNFLILIGLLWHFAYKPIIRAMDERETTIRERLDEAEGRQAEAERKSRELDEKQQDLEAKREDLLTKAREDAEKRRQELIAEARERVEQNEAEWHDSLQRQKDELADELQRRTARHLVAATRRLLGDMADSDLETRIVDLFRRRLRDADQDTLAALRQAVSDADDRVRIVTAFDLPDTQHKQLHEQVTDLIDDKAEIEFGIDNTLLCGIELRAGDHRMSWSASDYLVEMHERIETAISAVAEREPDWQETEANVTPTKESDSGAQNGDE